MFFRLWFVVVVGGAVDQVCTASVMYNREGLLVDCCHTCVSRFAGSDGDQAGIQPQGSCCVYLPACISNCPTLVVCVAVAASAVEAIRQCILVLVCTKDSLLCALGVTLCADVLHEGTRLST